MISDERGRTQRWGGRQSVCTHLQLLTEASALLGGLGKLGLEPGDGRGVLVAVEEVGDAGGDAPVGDVVAAQNALIGDVVDVQK